MSSISASHCLPVIYKNFLVWFYPSYSSSKRKEVSLLHVFTHEVVLEHGSFFRVAFTMQYAWEAAVVMKFGKFVGLETIIRVAYIDLENSQAVVTSKA
jgi:hypothetical protein